MSRHFLAAREAEDFLDARENDLRLRIARARRRSWGRRHRREIWRLFWFGLVCAILCFSYPWLRIWTFPHA